MAINVQKKVIWASSIGNILEYYDFAIYGFLTPIIAVHFFPNDKVERSIFLTFAVYAVGFLARPLGAIFFGYFGDLYGRKKSLVTSIFLMALTSFIIGLLPTYDQLGIYSGYLLTLLRFIQGIAMGGEYSGSVIFAMEHSTSQSTKYLSGAFIASSTLIGCLLAAITSSCFFYFDWLTDVWRGPFLFGSVIAFGGFYLRTAVTETPEFIKRQHLRKEGLNILKEIVKYKREFLCSLFLIALTGINAGISTTFFSVFFTKYLKFSMYQSLLFISIGLLFYTLFSLLSGYLNSFILPNKIFFYTALIIALTTPIFFHFLSMPLSFYVVIGVLICFSSLSGLLWGNINQITYGLFPLNVRYRLLALSDSLGRVLFASTAPLVASAVFGSYGSLSAVGVYISIFCFICCYLVYSHFATTR